MRETVRIIAFVLLIIGTVGLLVNEFVVGWGRSATLTFAAFNILGFITLALMTWGFRPKS